MVARLLDKYKNEVSPALTERFGYRNPNARLIRISIAPLESCPFHKLGGTIKVEPG